MIQKITNGEYLKRFDNMSGAERQTLTERVGQWLRSGARLLARKAEDPMARLQNVMQVSNGWNDAECQAWTDGVILLTAFVGTAETWLPEMIYAKAAKRTIKRMVEVLKEQAGTHSQSVPVMKAGGQPQGKAGTAAVGSLVITEEQKQRIVEKYTKKAMEKTAASEGTATPNGGVPVRPKHIDQYAHLLPEKTQERAATVKGLLRELDVARENARRLADANEHADKIAQWAKEATRLDEKVKSIYKELDAEWDKLVQQGRVVVDDLGNAHVVEPAVTRQETEQANDEEKAEAAETAKRIEYLKKWLRDTRTKASDERRELWEKNCKELLSLGGELTDSIRKAAEVYGVSLDDITL